MSGVTASRVQAVEMDCHIQLYLVKHHVGLVSMLLLVLFDQLLLRALLSHLLPF